VGIDFAKVDFDAGKTTDRRALLRVGNVFSIEETVLTKSLFRRKFQTEKFLVLKPSERIWLLVVRPNTRLKILFLLEN
jgi:hypothetical protein